nr:hypothetical protein [Tanacetum cinerariifolium]
MEQNIDSSGFDKIQTPKYPNMSKEVFQAKGNLIKSIQTFLEKFNCIPFGEMPKLLLQAWEKFFAIQHAQPEDTNELFQKLLEDLQIINEELAEYINSSSWNRLIFYNDDEEHYVQYKEYIANSLNFDIRQLVREECCIEVCREKKKKMEDMMLELLEVCRQKEFYCMHNTVDDLIESALNSKLLSINLESQRLDKKKQEVKNVVEQPTKRGTQLVSLEEENDVYQEDEEFDLEDILQIQDIILREKLLSVNRLIADIESLNDNLLWIVDHTKETRSGSTTNHANNSLPEYDSFCFDIESNQERFTNVVKKDISDDLSNDPLLEEVDVFLASENSIPLGIENFNYDSEGDIHFLEELLVNDSISILENESYDFYHQDDPSFLRPPLKPPDVEFFFDFKPNSGELILAMINNINELNEDECFDPGGEINVFVNIKDDD